jgi:hypothetical protein
MTATQIALWLRTAPAERSAALDDLMTSGDVRLVDHDGEPVLVRGHDRDVTLFEVGAMPVLPVGAG